MLLDPLGWWSLAHVSTVRPCQRFTPWWAKNQTGQVLHRGSGSVDEVEAGQVGRQRPEATATTRAVPAAVSAGHSRFASA
ncbi:hypothetical protein [Micromonospora ureilytica]|uniref:hypothetical protein n=1 Tax=Micromonospora ureilytica TaxID=709868 RepID=UPI0039906375|nr:hypothetical protein OHB55_22045 [Micromonospora ureilytica]